MARYELLEQGFGSMGASAQADILFEFVGTFRKAEHQAGSCNEDTESKSGNISIGHLGVLFRTRKITARRLKYRRGRNPVND